MKQFKLTPVNHDSVTLHTYRFENESGHATVNVVNSKFSPDEMFSDIDNLYSYLQNAMVRSNEYTHTIAFFDRDDNQILLVNATDALRKVYTQTDDDTDLITYFTEVFFNDTYKGL